MKTKLAAFMVAALSLVAMVGCTSFSNNTFRSEQVATDLVFTAYVGYTNALPKLDLTREQVDMVYDFRLKFAATIGTIEALRATLPTNSAAKIQIKDLIDSANNQSSNIVWLVNYLKGKS